MKISKNILIINTGGTFNKRYNELNGSLVIKSDNNIIKEIFSKSKISGIKIDGLIYKDSLDITNDDRKSLVEYIIQSKYKKIIIIHGTDTIDKTASFLDKYIKDKQIILTASMVPYSIDKVEAISNLMTGYGYLLSNKKNGIRISIHGMVKKYKNIKKNRKLGVFECH